MSRTLEDNAQVLPNQTIDRSYLRRIIFNGAIATGLIKGLGAVVSYLFQIGFARWAGKLEYGIYAYAWSWVQMLGLVCIFGIPTALLKFIPHYSAKLDWSRLAGLLRLSQRAALGAGLVAGALFIIVALIWTASPMRWALIVAGGMIPLMAYLLMQQYVILGFCKIIASTAPFNLLRPIAGGVFVYGAYRLWGKITGANIILCAAAALVLVIAVQRWTITRQGEIREHPAPPQYDEWKVWLRIAWAAFLSTVFLQVLGQADLLIVGAVGGPVNAGLFNAANRTAAFLAFFYLSFNNIAAPMISRLYAAGDMTGLRRVVRIYNHGAFWPALTIALLVIVFSRPLLMLYGKDFVAARPALILLLIGQLIKAMTGPVGYMLLVMGREWEALRVYAVVSVLDVILCFSLVPHYGIIGAAVANLVCIALWNFTLLFFVYRHFRIISLPI